MSNDRLRMKLARVGIDEEVIAMAERPELLNMYAEYLLLPPGAVGGGTTTLSEEELALRRSAEEKAVKELELKEREMERQEARAMRELELREKRVNSTVRTETEGVRIERT